MWNVSYKFVMPRRRKFGPPNRPFRQTVTQGNFAAVVRAYNTPGRDVAVGLSLKRTVYRIIEKYRKTFTVCKKRGAPSQPKKWD